MPNGLNTVVVLNNTKELCILHFTLERLIYYFDADVITKTMRGEIGVRHERTPCVVVLFYVCTRR